MPLFTGKGDDGSTTLFGSDERVSKASCQTETLGALDELNSLVGMCRARSQKFSAQINGDNLTNILEGIQHDLFIIQALIAGSPKELNVERVEKLEGIIKNIEEKLPPVKTFLLSGGTELSSLLDYTRAVTRRAERILINLTMEGGAVPENIVAYLNRLSSVFYALVRFVNHEQGVREIPPTY
jgi:cob(I)alamin adenosyltransferase